MAAQLSNNMNDIKEVTNLMEEARRQGVPVLGPDERIVVQVHGEPRKAPSALAWGPCEEWERAP